MALYGYFASLATEIANTGVGVTICCPGPAATGRSGAPRAVYGPNGLLQQEQDQATQEKGNSARMTPEVGACMGSLGPTELCCGGAGRIL